MRFLRATALALLALLPATAAAQARQTPVLTLTEALRLARQNNPAYLQTVNNRGPASAALRTAYGQLLPSADASFRSQYQEGGQQIVQGATLGVNADLLQSSYGLGLGYRVNGATFIQPQLAAATRNAVDADIRGAESVLESRVTQQYLTVLQAQARAVLADTLVATSQGQLELVQAREAVGSATILDVRRAEVELGQQEIAALQAHNQVEIEKLRLFQEIGVQQPRDVTLTSEFPVEMIEQSLDELLDLARERNPVINALRSRERAASMNVRRARSEYTPTLSLSTGWSGYTRQFRDSEFPVQQELSRINNQRAGCFTQDSLRVGAGMPSIADYCSTLVFSESDATMIRAENNQYPFNFTRSPWSMSAMLSIPLFDGFAREQRVQEASAQRADARHEVRARELALTADVTSAYLMLITAFRTVELQEQNALRARDEVRLAEERFRVGAATFLDVTEARSSFERAESERINAIYDFHKANAALVNAVGRPLR